ncbi:unknown [Firmicutes bacterium CAG:114]|nr:unknown [Firmicutes bacterium CAG:114]
MRGHARAHTVLNISIGTVRRVQGAVCQGGFCAVDHHRGEGPAIYCHALELAALGAIELNPMLGLTIGVHGQVFDGYVINVLLNSNHRTIRGLTRLNTLDDLVVAVDGQTSGSDGDEVLNFHVLEQLDLGGRAGSFAVSSLCSGEGIFKGRVDSGHVVLRDGSFAQLGRVCGVVGEAFQAGFIIRTALALDLGKVSSVNSDIAYGDAGHFCPDLNILCQIRLGQGEFGPFGIIHIHRAPGIAAGGQVGCVDFHPLNHHTGRAAVSDGDILYGQFPGRRPGVGAVGIRVDAVLGAFVAHNGDVLDGHITGRGVHPKNVIFGLAVVAGGPIRNGGDGVVLTIQTGSGGQGNCGLIDAKGAFLRLVGNRNVTLQCDGLHIGRVLSHGFGCILEGGIGGLSHPDGNVICVCIIRFSIEVGFHFFPSLWNRDNLAGIIVVIRRIGKFRPNLGGLLQGAAGQGKGGGSVQRGPLVHIDGAPDVALGVQVGCLDLGAVDLHRCVAAVLNGDVLQFYRTRTVVGVNAGLGVRAAHNGQVFDGGSGFSLGVFHGENVRFGLSIPLLAHRNCVAIAVQGDPFGHGDGCAVGGDTGVVQNNIAVQGNHFVTGVVSTARRCQSVFQRCLGGDFPLF